MKTESACQKLSAGPAEEAPKPQEGAEEPKEYRGEFYPTVAHAPKQKDNEPSKEH